MSAASVVREADHHARSFVIQTTRRCVFRVVVLGACAHSVIATAGDPSSMATARIDDFCDRVWREHSIQPAAEATDSEYARRLSLDITGSIPHAADMRTFLADRSEIKRLRFAHAMLGGAGHVRHQMTVWHRLLLPPTMTPSVGRWHADLDAWLAAGGDRYEDQVNEGMDLELAKRRADPANQETRPLGEVLREQGL